MTKLTKDISRETSTVIRDTKGVERVLTITVKAGDDGDVIILRPKSCSVDTLSVSLKDIWKLAVASTSHGGMALCRDCKAELEKRIA
jgi:hypothetical protein